MSQGFYFSFTTPRRRLTQSYNMRNSLFHTTCISLNFLPIFFFFQISHVSGNAEYRLATDLKDNIHNADVTTTSPSPSFGEFIHFSEPILANGEGSDCRRLPGTLLSLDKEISGQVSDAETGETIVGVAIRVKATGIGTISDAKGNYRLSIPDEHASLIFSYVGYVSKEVSIGNETTINVYLKTDSKELSEVVITALGIEKDKRSVGSAVQEIHGSEISEARETNMVSNLSGKIAGLNIQQTSTGVAG